jgi:hypothetical protein
VVTGNEQIVRPLYPKHLHPDQYGRDHDRVHTVYTYAVHALKPVQCAALFTDVARIRAHLRHRPARFDSTKHVPLCQMLMLD